MKNKKTKIFETALKLFTTKGFHNTPTSLIAKEAGVATGTLFHYFKTKEDLINSLYLECKDSMKNAMLEGITDNDDIAVQIKKIWMNTVRWGLNNTNEFLFFQQFSNSTFITKSTRNEGTNRLAFLYDFVEENKRAGILKDIPSDLLIDITYGTISAVIYNILKFPERLDDKTYLEKAFLIFWDSVRK
jgi:AcrR family transcriptional regulator